MRNETCPESPASEPPPRSLTSSQSQKQTARQGGRGWVSGAQLGEQSGLHQDLLIHAESDEADVKQSAGTEGKESCKAN